MKSNIVYSGESAEPVRLSRAKLLRYNFVMAVALPSDIYEMLEARLGKEDAKAFVKAVESAIDDSSMRKKIEIEGKLTHELVTRELFEERMARMEDRIERRLAENRAEIIKWMFIFWCGQLGAIAAFLKFLR